MNLILIILEFWTILSNPRSRARNYCIDIILFVSGISDQIIHIAKWIPPPENMSDTNTQS